MEDDEIYLNNKDSPENNFKIEIKIGKSKNAYNRLRELQTSNINKLKIFYKFETYMTSSIEKELHHKFIKYNVRGELFRFTNKKTYIESIESTKYFIDKINKIFYNINEHNEIKLQRIAIKQINEFKLNDFQKTITSKIKTLDDKIICPHCGASFGYTKNYNRHIKFRCKKLNSDISICENTTSDIEKTNINKIQNDENTEIIKMMREMMTEIKKMVEMKKDIVNLSNMHNNKKIDIIKFYNQKFNIAPPIKQLEKNDVSELMIYILDEKKSSFNR